MGNAGIFVMDIYNNHMNKDTKIQPHNSLKHKLQEEKYDSW